MSSNADSWTAIEITVPAAAAEAIEYFFNEIDSLGTEINQLRRAKTETVTVVGYFVDRPNLNVFEEQLDLALRAYGFDRRDVESVTERNVENADWLQEWKKHWKPTRVGRFLVAPSWVDTSGGHNTISIRIEPNMAFGTGTHETTKLCLKAIEDHYTPGMSFLDVGTGTGILAIAAAKLQKKYDSKETPTKILALDTDTDSVKIARENAAQNAVSDVIKFAEGSVTEATPHVDFISANLTLDVILPMLSMLLEKTNQILVLSGILAEQKGQIVHELDRLRANSPVIERDGEWISVLVRR